MSKLSRQQVDPGGQNRNFWFIRSILPKGPSELEILLFRHYDRFRQKNHQAPLSSGVCTLFSCLH